MKIFLSAPYRADVKYCTLKVQDIKDKLQAKYPGYEFFIPHGKWTGMTEREAMLKCIETISASDAVWVVGPYHRSNGVQAEIAFCRAALVPYEMKVHLWFDATDIDAEKGRD